MEIKLYIDSREILEALINSDDFTKAVMDVVNNEEIDIDTESIKRDIKDELLEDVIDEIKARL